MIRSLDFNTRRSRNSNNSVTHVLFFAVVTPVWRSTNVDIQYLDGVQSKGSYSSPKALYDIGARSDILSTDFHQHRLSKFSTGHETDDEADDEMWIESDMGTNAGIREQETDLNPEEDGDSITLRVTSKSDCVGKRTYSEIGGADEDGQQYDGIKVPAAVTRDKTPKEGFTKSLIEEGTTQVRKESEECTIRLGLVR